MNTNIILGGGQTGGWAAVAMRQAGFSGRILLIGDEVFRPYERPPLSKAWLLDRDEPSIQYFHAEGRYAELGIEFLGSRTGIAIDPIGQRIRLDDDTVHAYDKLLLATGAVPRRMLRDGVEIAHIAYLRTLDDAAHIRRRLGPGRRIAIIGGGFIGLELAASAITLGAKVTVIEVLPRLLSRGVPAEIAAIIADRHQRAGVDVITGTAIASIDTSSDTARITLADGRVIETDILVAGIGAIPVTGLAEAAGLEIANGIAVDLQLRTSDPDIFAAGDCCAFPLAIYGGRRVRLESWRNAQDQGALAARNMLGAADAHSAVPWFWSDQYELSLQIAGLSDEGKTIVRRELGEGAFILFHLADDGRLVAASGIGVGNAVAKDIRLAEMLIGRAARPEPAALARADVKLKSLLAA